MYLIIRRSRDDILDLLALKVHRISRLISLAYILRLIEISINTLTRELDEDLVFR